MSYCRWSTDDFACDLYVYERTAGGYRVDVAGSRHVGTCPHVDWSGFLAERIDPATLAAQQATQHAWLMACERRPIELPHAGGCFDERNLAALRARLVALRGLGYRFPDDVLATIDAEMAEEADLRGDA